MVEMSGTVVLTRRPAAALRVQSAGSLLHGCLDTGAVFGGRMTALRRPERELVDVPAVEVWYEPVKPLTTEAPGGQYGRRSRS